MTFNTDIWNSTLLFARGFIVVVTVPPLSFNQLIFFVSVGGLVAGGERVMSS